MLVDLVGQLKRRYLATAFSFVGSLTSCGAQADEKTAAEKKQENPPLLSSSTGLEKQTNNASNDNV